MAFLSHAELSAHKGKAGDHAEGGGDKFDAARMNENLQLAGYESRAAACPPGEAKFINDVRKDLQVQVDKAQLPPDQKKDAEKYLDALAPKCGQDGSNSEKQLKDIETKYSQDKKMTKLLKDMKERATLSFD
ncbi:MAG TPA: hypothetical protein V6C89_07970 [Drouetiella sp.]|jgi:hypothetical protein